jgi:hypothetical protein
MKTYESGVTLPPAQNGSDNSEPTTFVIGGKAMAKLIDTIADLYYTGSHRVIDAMGEIALVIDRANIDVKFETEHGILDFADRELLSEVTDWLQETDGVYRVAFRDGYVCKHEVGAEEEEEETVEAT